MSDTPGDIASLPFDDNSDSDFVVQLAEEFVARCRLGEQPTLDEYTDRYPQLAELIREVFPTIAMMEHIAIVDRTKPNDAKPGEIFRPFRLGDYRIIREIGRGGMGIVYEAEQISLNRRVAVKVLPSQFHANEKYKRRFEREAQAAAKLHHTNIVPVFGVGEQDKVPFYVMQLISGLGLDAVLKQIWRIRNQQPEPTFNAAQTVLEIAQRDDLQFSPLTRSFLTGRFAKSDTHETSSGKGLKYIQRSSISTDPVETTAVSDHGKSVEPSSTHSTSNASDLLANSSTSGRATRKEQTYFQRVASLGVQINDALEYAHQQGIVHRDIKPSNLILDHRGKVWVTDFGLAKLNDQDDLTQTGDLLGTIRYMPPESLEGKSDARSDVYSLGITMFEMLALRPAFDERDRGKLLKLLAGDGSPSLLKIVPEIPRDLAIVIHKAIAPDPSRRYQTPAEFSSDLKLFLEDRPIRARHANSLEQLGRWVRRSPALATLTGVSLFLLLAALVIFAVGNYRLTEALRDSLTNLHRAQNAERDSRLREADALVGKARGFRLSRREGQRIAALEAIAEAAKIGRDLKQPEHWFAPLRNEAIAAMSLPDLHIAKHWPGNPRGTKEICISADNRRYARLSENNILSVRTVEGDREIGQFQLESGSSSIAFSPDGNYLSCLRTMSPSPVLQFWKVTDTGIVDLLRSELSPPDGSPSVAYLVDQVPPIAMVAKPNGIISIMDLDKSIERWNLNPQIITAYPELSIHPKKPLVAISSYRTNRVVIRNYETGEVLLTETPPWQNGSTAAWHPSGSYLCISQSDNEGVTRIYQFDDAKNQLMYTRSLIMPHGHSKLAFSRSGDRVFVTGWRPNITMGDFWTGERLFETRTASMGIPVDGNRIGLGVSSEDATRIGSFTVAESSELRSIKPSSMLENNYCYDFAIHPNGRLIVVNFDDGIHFFELHTGRELAYVPRTNIPSDSTKISVSVFFDRNESLYLNSFAGLFRYAITTHPERPNHMIVGPPQRLPFHAGFENISASSNGMVVAQPMHNGYGMSEFAGGWVSNQNQPARWIDRKEGRNSSSVSPDGKWVAFGSKVYEVTTNQLVFERANEYLHFSANGKWLWGSDRYSKAYEVGSWKLVADLGEGAVVDSTRDSRIAVLLLPATNDTFRLVDMESGRELARLQSPEQSVRNCELTPDGNRIVFQSEKRVCVWDLRLVRKRLAEMGLDWIDETKISEPSEKTKLTMAEEQQHSTGQLTLDIVAVDLMRDPSKFAAYEYRRLLLNLVSQPWEKSHYVALGRHWLWQADFDKAYWLLTLALAMQAEQRVLEDRAEAAFRTDRWQVLLSDVEQFQHKSDAPERWRLRRALALRSLGRFNEAILDLNKSIDELPRSVSLYLYRGDTFEKLGREVDAAADFARAVEIQATSPSDSNDLAWKLITGPSSQWLPERAYEILQNSFQTEESRSVVLNTLGVASYRVGKFQEALEFLERSLSSGKGQYDAFDQYFIAMCHAKLGDLGKAQVTFEIANAWLKKNLIKLNESDRIQLTEFRSEAQKLLNFLVRASN